jgi:hypothetical protein
MGSQEGKGGWNDHKLSLREVGLNEDESCYRVMFMGGFLMNQLGK